MRRQYKCNDLSGLTFGLLTVEGRAERIHPVGIREPVRWKCECICGNYCIHSSTTLVRSNQREENLISCGCTRKKRTIKDLTGLRFGRLVVLGIPREGGSKSHWKCKCDCGTNQRTASLDRIDNMVGYIKGNVQWLHKHINKMKFVYEEDYFVELCKDVAKYKGE